MAYSNCTLADTVVYPTHTKSALSITEDVFDDYVLAAAVPSAEQRLLRDLLRDYSTNVRPVLNRNHTTRLVFGMELVQLVNVDDRNQMITTNVWVRQIWENELLTWHPDNYQGVKVIRLDPKQVWTPDIVLYNSADNVFSGGVDKYRTRVIILSSGSSRWFSPASFRSTCKIDVTYFPFDQQKCNMKFGSWTFTVTELDVITSNVPTFSSKYVKSAEWDLMSASTKRGIQKYACCEQPFSDITVDIVIRRKPLFYAFNLITPCMILLTMILLGFFLPPESGERITLSITVLLAMAVFLQLVAETLPRNSESIPLLGRFYITIMTEIAVSLMATCWVLNIHHRNSGTTLIVAMPNWIDVLILHWLATVLCVRKPPRKFELFKHKDPERCHHVSKNKLDAENLYSPPPTVNGDVQMEEYSDPLRPSHVDASQKFRTITLNGVPSGKTVTSIIRNRSFEQSYENHCLRDLRVLTDYTRLQRKIEQNQQKWKHVAMVMDRLFFWIFIGTILVSTMVIFKEKIRQALDGP